MDHNFTHTAWDDLNGLIASMVGSDAMIAHDPSSVLAPLVRRYACARMARAVCSMGAACFVLATAVDLAGSSYALCVGLGIKSPCHLQETGVRRLCRLRCWHPRVQPSRLVSLLGFGPLGRCCSEFCKGVALSMKTAIGAGLLTKTSIEFLPLLVCLAWTLFRIGLFLSSEGRNAEAVNALMWVTLSSMLRLSPLAGTAAFVASASVAAIGVCRLSGAAHTATGCDCEVQVQMHGLMLLVGLGALPCAASFHGIARDWCGYVDLATTA